jgi:two-component system, OmpR family, phosphate regulon response regulator PhoB
MPGRDSARLDSRFGRFLPMGRARRGGGPVANVLAVEDSIDEQLRLGRVLEPHLHVVFEKTLEGALRRLESDAVDLVLLDVSLPDGDGFQLCSMLRGDDRFRGLPVIFLTSRSETRDKVLAFSLGAEDYVEKPYDALELRARIQAKLRRARGEGAQAELLCRGDLQLHAPSLRASLRDGARTTPLDLTPHEFRLLYHLAAGEDRVFTRLQLLEAVWGPTIVVERTVDTHVCNLRRKLGPYRDCVESIRGVGYRFRRPRRRRPD